MSLRPLTQEELRAVAEFERTMREETIPRIVQDVQERELRAQESRRWLVSR